MLTEDKVKSKRSHSHGSAVDIGMLRREVKEDHDRNPAWTLDNAFVHWFLKAFLVSDDELAARAVTGVSHDKGVDAVFIDEGGRRVFLHQGKCHLGEKPPLENRSDVLSFAQLARVLTSAESEYLHYRTGLDPLVAKKLDEARNRVRRRGYQLDLYYVTTGTCSSPLKDESEAVVGQVAARADFRILDRPEILALLADYLGGAAPPVPYLDLRIDAKGVVGSDGVVQRFDTHSGIESWILTMTGKDVASLYATAGDRLFARNIRGFLGNTAINEGMIETLKREAEHFWYFNNGITIICNSARKTAEKGQAVLRVSNPQVINGQQTTRTLHNSPQHRASVLVRVISIPRSNRDGEGAFEQMVSSIVAATNWQNAILQSDLRSNDARQISLEREFARLRYRYMRKRQTKREARRQFGTQHYFWVKKEELAQCIAACEFDPDVVRSGKEGLFKGQYYDEIFDGRPIHEYMSAYWLGRVVKRSASGYPDRAYAKWHVLHFLWGHLGRELRKRVTSERFRTECERNRWSAALDSATRLAYLSAIDFYRNNRGPGARAVDISNFFYRSNQHVAFDKFWRSGKNRRRSRTMLFLSKFVTELSTE
jgi:hypothetical protein